MRREDRDRFLTPYSASSPQETGFLAALGIRLEHCSKLSELIFADLDAEKFGIGWWSPALDSKRRILIGDYLMLTASAVATNLIEAKIHLMEAQGASEAVERQAVGAVRVLADRSRHAVSFPTPSCPEDELHSVLVQLHVVGCVRSLASALDCFASVVVGTLGLPKRIFRVKYLNALDDLRRLASTSGPLSEAAAEILRLQVSAGPKSWDGWLLDYRNMLVHRGRHLWMTKLVTKEVAIHTPSGEVVVPHSFVPVLPRDPGRSEVEVLRDASPEAFLLTESGWSTLAAAFESTLFLCESGSRILSAAWSMRRAEPSKWPQPAAQWPEVADCRAAEFPGYEPGSVPFDPTEFHTSPDFVRRLQAAHLEGNSRARWWELDG